MHAKTVLRKLLTNSSHFYGCYSTQLSSQLHPVAQESSSGTFKPDQLDPKQWRIEVALAIYRPPVIAPPMSTEEREFAELSEHLDTATSYKCDFELKREKETLLLKKRKQFEAEGRDLSKLDQELGTDTFHLSAEWSQKAEKVTKKYGLDDPVEAVTDPQSLARHLDRKLLLVVRQKFPDSKTSDYLSPWTLPQMANDGVETLRQTVDRCLHTIVPMPTSPDEDEEDDSQFGFKLFGNAPVAHSLISYSYSMRKHLGGFHGSAVFFYPVQVVFTKTLDQTAAKVDFNKELIASHKWYTREELEGRMKWGRKYGKAVGTVLVE